MTQHFREIVARISEPRQCAGVGGTTVTAPVTMLVGGLEIRPEGSSGPEVAPTRVLAESVADWVGQPVTDGHPRVLGRVVAARMDGDKLKADLALNRAAMKAAGLEHLIDDGVSGVSVGMLVGMDDDGRNWKSARPNHLAILDRDKPACSVEDGCGLRVAAGRFGVRAEALAEAGLRAARCGCNDCASKGDDMADDDKNKGKGADDLAKTLKGLDDDERAKVLKAAGIEVAKAETEPPPKSNAHDGPSEDVRKLQAEVESLKKRAEAGDELMGRQVVKAARRLIACSHHTDDDLDELKKLSLEELEQRIKYAEHGNTEGTDWRAASAADGAGADDKRTKNGGVAPKHKSMRSLMATPKE